MKKMMLSTGNPEVVNKDPYGEGWIIKAEMKDPSEVNSLLDAAAYRLFRH